MLEIKTTNAIIRIHFPDISDEENARRMKAVEQAAVNLAIANRRAEAIRHQQENQPADAS